MKQIIGIIIENWIAIGFILLPIFLNQFILITSPWMSWSINVSYTLFAAYVINKYITRQRPDGNTWIASIISPIFNRLFAEQHAKNIIIPKKIPVINYAVLHGNVININGFEQVRDNFLRGMTDVFGKLNICIEETQTLLSPSTFDSNNGYAYPTNPCIVLVGSEFDKYAFECGEGYAKQIADKILSSNNLTIGQLAGGTLRIKNIHENLLEPMPSVVQTSISSINGLKICFRAFAAPTHHAYGMNVISYFNFKFEK